MTRILLAVPLGAQPIDPACAEALWRLDRCGCEVVLRIVGGYDCARARNDIAQTALDLCCDAALTVDADVIVPNDALARLLEGDAPLVLGCYPRKDGSGAAEIFEPAEPRWSKMPQWDALPQGRFRVDGGGFGCALVRTELFRKLGRPYFQYVEHRDGSILSEDLFFCERLLTLGIPVEADGRVRCAHVGRRVWE